VAYKFATSGSETSGTWTNANAVACQIYRGAFLSGTPVINSGGQTGTSATVNYSGITTMVDPNASWVLRFAGNTSIDTALETPPTGHTFRVGNVGATCEVAGFDTNGSVVSSSFGSTSVGGTTGNYVTKTLELIPDHSTGGVAAKTAQLAGGTVTGNLAVTSPGMQPKAIITWNGLQTSTGAVADTQFSFGVGDMIAGERNSGYNSDDTVATSDSDRWFRTGDLIRNYVAGTTTSTLAASLTSLDPSGFTLNWGDVTVTSALYNYMAIGGKDITNTKVGDFTTATTGATQAVTGVGFQPDVVFLFCTLQATNNVTNNNSQMSVGVMTPTAQWATGQRALSGNTTMNTARTLVTNRAISLLASATNTEFHGMSFASMDSDGFTLNIDTQGALGFFVGYLAIKGGSWKVGTETQKTSTGTKATTGVGFTPKGIMFAGACDTATGPNDHGRMFFGGSTGASNNTAHWTGDRDATADAIANSITSATKCIVMATEATSVAPTTDAEAALSSFDSDGFTLNWTTADASARIFGYVAFGDKNATSTTTLVPNGAPTVNTGWPDNGDNLYTKVNTDDGDTSYIYTPTANSKVSYPASDSGLSTGTVYSVTVGYKIKSLDPATSTARTVVRTSSTDYTGFIDDTITDNTQYLEFKTIWYVNPATGVAWTWADVDGLQIGVEKINTAGQRVTYIYALVTYIAAGGSPVTGAGFFALI
jgi:hypothetical protein